VQDGVVVRRLIDLMEGRRGDCILAAVSLSSVALVIFVSTR